MVYYHTDPISPVRCFHGETKLITPTLSTIDVSSIKKGELLLASDSRVVKVKKVNKSLSSAFLIESTKNRGVGFILGEDHILPIKASGFKWAGRRTGDILHMSVKEISNLGSYLGSAMIYKNDTLIFPAYELPLDPYTLGLWLGDGTSIRAAVTNMDQPIIDYLCSAGQSWGDVVGISPIKNNRAVTIRFSGPGVNKRSKMRKDLMDLNLLGNKHIPPQYLLSSVHDRLQLLAGLIDSDGSLGNKKAFYKIGQKSEKLCREIQTLARSLGFGTSIRSATYPCETRNNSTHWALHIWGDAHTVPVLLERKKKIKSDKVRVNPLVGKPKLTPLGSQTIYTLELENDTLLTHLLLEDFTNV